MTKAYRVTYHGRWATSAMGNRFFENRLSTTGHLIKPPGRPPRRGSSLRWVAKDVKELNKKKGRPEGVPGHPTKSSRVFKEDYIVEPYRGIPGFTVEETTVEEAAKPAQPFRVHSTIRGSTPDEDEYRAPTARLSPSPAPVAPDEMTELRDLAEAVGVDLGRIRTPGPAKKKLREAGVTI